MTVLPADAYRAVDDRLAPLHRFADAGERAFKPGFDRILALLHTLGDPQESLPVVHVAGTNGKGSTASMIAAACTASGLRTGLHTSPHVSHVGERMCVDGVPARPDWLLTRLGTLESTIRSVEPSYFEVTVALSLAFFAEAPVDIAVVEVGLGGRLDATNVVHPVLSLVTEIDLDHTALLGDTLDAIAREKAGIFRPDVPALSSARHPAAMAALRDEAVQRGTLLELVASSCSVHIGPGLEIVTPVRRYGALKLALRGAYQAQNAVLAVRSMEYLAAIGGPFERIQEATTREGLLAVNRLTGFRGRAEVLRQSPPVLADVAHNAAGLAAALDTFAECFPEAGPPTLLLSAMRDKDLRAIGGVVAGRVRAVRPVRIDSPRALSPEDMVEVLRKFVAIDATLQSPSDAVVWAATAADEPVLFAGSFQLVGPALALWEA